MELYYPSSENRGADQLRGYREADLRLCFRLSDCWFSHEADRLCTISVNQTSMIDCQNGGTPFETSCLCPKNFTGEHCETPE